MKVTVDTSDKTTVYTGGEYPVGHITQVVKQYVMKAELADNLLKNMKARIVILEKEQSDNDTLHELKMQLHKVGAWYEPQSVWADDYTGVPEVDMQLRHAPCEKLGSRSL
jgi:hypothetical protein